MKHHLSILIKMFLRSLWLWLPYVLVWTGSLVFDLFRVKSFMEYHFWDSMYFNMVTMTMYFSLAGYALFLYLGYEITAKAQDVRLSERLVTLPYETKPLTLCTLLFFVFLALSFSLPAMVVNAILFWLNPLGTWATLFNQLGACLLYYVLTPLVGACMGMGLGRLLGTKRITVYGLALLLILLTTGFLDRFFTIPSMLSEAKGMTNALFFLKSLFTFTPMAWPFNTIPTFSIAFLRNWLVGFWGASG